MMATTATSVRRRLSVSSTPYLRSQPTNPNNRNGMNTGGTKLGANLESQLGVVCDF
jgi:hypothetical protein